MPMLEDGFDRLYWPRTIKGARITMTHPGYEYEFFQTYAELNKFMSKECGHDWRTQEWAKFWIDQHSESVNSDNREQNYTDAKIYKSKKDTDAVYTIAAELLQENPYLSCRRLTYLLNRKNVPVKKTRAAALIKRFKEESGNG